MQYPDNFDTPTFPAGRRIAISRMMAIGTMVAFIIAIFLCVLVGWTARSRSVDPIVVSIDPTTGAWDVVGHSHGQFEYSANYTLQESIVVGFVRDWFSISTDGAENAARWNGECNRETQCDGSGDVANSCKMYCACDDNVFRAFTENVLPEYKMRIEYGEYRTMDMTTVRVEPISEITNNGGKWRVYGTIKATLWRMDGMVDGDIDVIAFVRVGRNAVNYPRTMGFYIADFNSYVINQ